MVAISEAHGFGSWIDDGLAVLACVQPEDHSFDPRHADEFYRRLLVPRARAAWRNVVSLCLFAEAFGTMGDPGKGLEALGAIPEAHRRILYAPEIERIRGDLLLRRDEREEAEQCFRRSIELARQREERSFELRAATRLARLLDGRSKRDEARTLLGPVYGWFTEGCDTKDLREARALLDALA